jgi:iron complex outermembrane receptor protein
MYRSREESLTMKTTTARLVSRILAGAAVSAIAISSSTAFAQAADETDSNIITVIGVTKTAANIQDTPTAITVFTGETLENQGIKEFSDLGKFTPGFNIRAGSNNPTAIALSMRGQVQNDVLATLEPSVGVYVDEVYVARAYGLNAEMMDMSNVQALKGPQGTLFGRNTSAGALLLTTNDAKLGETSGSLKLTYGRFNEWNATGVVNLAVGDNLALRGALSYGERDGFKRDINTGHKYNGRKSLNGRVKLTWQPYAAMTVQLSGEWLHGKMDGDLRQGQALFLNPYLFGTSAPAMAQVAGLQAAADAELLKFKGNPDLVGAAPASATPGTGQALFNDVKTQTYTAKVKYDTGAGELKWITGYRGVKADNLIDLDGFSIPLHLTASTVDLKQYSSELQFTGEAMNDRLKFALGATWFRETGSDRSHTSTFGSPAWTQFLGTVDNTSWGIYGQGSYAVTDALNITAGLRWSHDRKGITQQSGNVPNRGPLTSCTPANPALLAADCARGREDSWSNLSYTFGLDYQITPDVMVYAKHSKGYRAGAQQLRSLTLNDTTPAKPEINNEQEIGLKTEFMDRRVRFNIAGFHNKVSDAQRSVILAVGGTSQTILENASMETWGVEADLNVRVAPGLDLFANGSLIDPKYTKYDGFVVVGGVLTPNDKKDTRLVSVVEKQFVLGANYEQNVGVGTFKFNVSYSWLDDMAQDGNTLARYVAPSTTPGGQGFTAAQAAVLMDATTTRAGGFTNARASLSFGPDENYEIAVWGKNIFDVRRTGYVLFLGGINYVGATWNDPATYGVTVTAKF